MKYKFIFLKDIIFNIFFSRKYKLFYIVENANWSIDWDGKNIIGNLNKLNLINGKISSTHLGLRNKIIHFGSLNTLVNKEGIKKVHKSNKIVLTCFHLIPNDTRLKFIPELSKKVALIHTACNLTKNKLVYYGIENSKIVIIPLGIDFSFFTPATKIEIRSIRKKLKIPENAFLVGSFQKDGNGWGYGEEPKLIKGPDIFCDVIENLAKKYPIFVILTGPARGYVKNRLTRAGIPFLHTYFKNFLDILPYYQILDFYLVCSRAEGGPKAIIECMACNVPLVSTKVGMAPDIIEDGFNGYLVDVDDRKSLIQKSAEILDNPTLKDTLAKNALNKIRRYDLTTLAHNYWERIYSQL